MAKLTKQDISEVYFRNLFALQFGWNHKKMQGLGYAYAIMLALKRFYRNDPDKMKRALKMHLAYFDITPAMPHLITGADITLKEEIGIESEEVVMGTKTGLMGPFAGMGGTLSIVIYRAVVFSITACVVLKGSPVGLLAPLITCTGVLWVRYKLATAGYNSGRKLATRFVDKVALVTEAVSILGPAAVGALIPSVIKYNTDLQSTSDEVTFTLQEMLDKILPCMLSLGIVMLSYWLLGKKKIDSIKLVPILIGLGVILGNLQSMLTFVAGLS